MSVYFMLALASPAFWLSIIILICLGLWRWYRFNNDGNHGWFDFTLKELALYCGIIVATCTVSTMITYYACSDLSDICILNGHSTQAEYHEPWTEEYNTITTTTDAKGNVTTQIQHHVVHHPAYWITFTTVGDVYISEDRYHNYVRRWGNQTKHFVHHINQTSVGDGNVYVTTWDGDMDTIVPASRPERVINYVKASHFTVEKRLGLENKTIGPFPSVYDYGFGSIRFDHLVDTVGVGDVYRESLNWHLALLNDELGAPNQCNIMVYLTNQQPDFYESLRTKWQGGKKNDIILVIGIDNDKNVHWANVICYAKQESFAVNLKSAVRDLGNIEKKEELIQVIRSNVRMYYNRKPMEEFKYLLKDIRIGILPSFIILVVNLIVSVIVLYFVENT